MKLTKSVFSLLLLSFGLVGAVNAASQTTCVATTTKVALTEEIIASVLRDADFRTYFDPSLETSVAVTRQGCATTTEGLYRDRSLSEHPLDGDVRMIKQVRDGVTHTWEQAFSGGSWVTVTYSYHKPFSKK